MGLNADPKLPECRYYGSVTLGRLELGVEPDGSHHVGDLLAGSDFGSDLGSSGVGEDRPAVRHAQELQQIGYTVAAAL